MLKDKQLLEERQRRREELYEKLNKAKLERDNKKEYYNNRAKEGVSYVPKFKEIERRYHEEIEFEDLESKKKKL